jgi:MFS family permease
MGLLGTQAGRVARKYGSKLALIVGTGVTALSFALLWIVHAAPIDMLISAGLLGIGIGLAFAALGNLVVQAVPATQTGVATGMNTVMRTLGGALGGQISATFIADHVAHGEPTVTGFNLTFGMATGFLIVSMLTAFLVPGPQAAAEAREREEEHLARQQELVGEPAIR